MIPERTLDAMARWARRGIPPGGFLTAVLEGRSLTEVVGRADAENAAALVEIARYISNHLPAQCHGSPERFRAWAELDWDRMPDTTRMPWEKGGAA